MSRTANQRPITIQPTTLSDGADGTNLPPGAMSTLQNLIPSPSTRNALAPRPAAELLTLLSDLGISGAGPISSMLVVGDRAYLMVPSNLTPGFDEPVVVDLSTEPPTLVTITGVTATNVPTTPAPDGDWTPPIMAQVGSRIVVTHPGFPGGTSTRGWLSVLTGNFVSGNTQITGDLFAGLVRPPFFVLDGIEVGQRLYGPSIVDETRITDIQQTSITTTGTGLIAQADITVASATGLAIGMSVACADITVLPAGAHINNIVGTTVTLSANLSAAASSDTFYFFGGGITMADQANGTATGEIFFVLGGGTAINFGWFDLGGFTQDLTVQMNLGMNGIYGGFSVFGIQPGMIVTGSHLPGAGTPVVATQTIVIQATAGATSGSQLLTGVTAVNYSGGLWTGGGFSVVGAGIPVGAYIIASDTTTGTVTLNVAATVTATIAITISGGLIVVEDAPAASDTFVSVTVTGGTSAAPQWGAGDLDLQPMPGVPVGVAQFNGRAYFAMGDEEDGVVFSDSGFACRRTNATQALVPANGEAVTAVAPLMLGAPLTGGIVKSLLAFQGTTGIQQILGDPAIFNLTMNLLPVATGTRAPLSIFPCELGTAFISPLGMRYVGFDGNVSPVVGEGGAGVTQAFQFAANPSRICAAATVGALRITTQNNLLLGVPFQEYWYHLSRGIWTGPHTFPNRLIQPWRSTFLVAPIDRDGELWQSDVYPTNESSYIENENQLQWLLQTALLPDNTAIKMNAVVEANLALAASSELEVTISALDEDQAVLGTDVLAAGEGNQNLRQRLIEWPAPIVFKQMYLRAFGLSDYTVTLGNLYLLYEILGYNLTTEGEGNYLLTDDGLILETDDPEAQLLAPG